jgi:hypothetical protein
MTGNSGANKIGWNYNHPFDNIQEKVLAKPIKPIIFDPIPGEMRP